MGKYNGYNKEIYQEKKKTYLGYAKQWRNSERGKIWIREYIKDPENIARKKKTDRERYLRKKEEIKAYSRKYRLENPEHILLRRTKNRAKKLGYDFNLTIDDVKIPKRCPIFKTKFVYGDRRLCASIDRIDNSKGYVKGNVQIISMRANRMKGDNTIKDFELLLEYMKKNI